MATASYEYADLGEIPTPAIERHVRMTEAEFYELPDARVEFDHGEAIFMAPLSLPHARLMLWLSSYLHTLATRGNLGTVFPDSVTVRLSPDVSRVPDISFVTHAGPAILRHTCIDGPPNLIIEIVSPESRERDYRRKFDDYESAGVQEYWLIDPVYQTIDLHRLVSGRYEKSAPTPDGTLHSTVVPDFRLNPQWLKRSPLPDPLTL